MKVFGAQEMRLLSLFLLWPLSSAIAADPPFEKQLSELKQANEQLKQQLQTQQKLIDSLSQKVSALDASNSETKGKEEEAAPRSPVPGFNLGKVRFTGEGGAAFFRSGRQGQFPNSEFRIDEAKLFVEAPLWTDTYFFSELNLTLREDPTEALKLGELYVDFENISRLWKQDGLLNLRLGRIDIPFGEEYMVRDVVDNPLITHSLSDIWGVDEGLEVYGRFRKFNYVLAIQNGGHPTLRDYNSDKAITARISLDPCQSVHLSLSGMRTGGLDVQGDMMSEMWFGNSFIRSLGSASTTVFRGDVVEGDGQYRWSKGHIKAAGGYLHYEDNDHPNNQRHVYYYYAEGLQHLTERLYVAARWSQILAPDGFPIVGNGNFSHYFFQDLTKDLWRLSAGAGWKFSQNLIVKGEYMFENGKTKTDGPRNHENMVSTELVFRF
jgi:hypothetical protein